MSLVRWDPFKNMATLQDRINRLFDDAFPRSAGGDEDLSSSAWHPLVDIFETDQGVSILVDLSEGSGGSNVCIWSHEWTPVRRNLKRDEVQYTG